MAELKKGSRVTGGERDRLAADLKRKYGDTVGEILAYVERARGRLEAVERQDQIVAELEARRAELCASAGALAWIDHDWAMRFLFDDRDCREIKCVARVSFEGADAALAEKQIRIFVRQDVLARSIIETGSQR